ncbi:RTA1 like protein-domain-containing protein [Ilyonectria robusta]|uniref:RTA1 like protein-domain-containing protein n=1 Tax=Ilyonectria robusta TaxID=1079257 RepID=UPI001E8CC9F2|nr:RTA1 like protein-domain-containing protein [Ilyonectria robusta]KAH8736621.1 RTA1 like protein-domain-containing protein [Ilyonectria robusta]
MSDGQPVAGSVYFYAPNKGAAIFGAAAFFASTAWHIWQCYRLRAWKVTTLIPFASLLFTVGFALRAYGAWNYDNVDVFLASTVLIYTAPPIYELANYHILGRILYYVPYCSPIHPGRTMTTFGTISAVVEVLNALGVSWSINPKIPSDLASLGETLLKASLIIQIVVILIFVGFVAWFQYHVKKRGLDIGSVNAPCLTMYVTSFLIFVRCIYRTVEHFGAEALRTVKPGDIGSISPIIRYEWFFYVFEVLPMIAYTFLWNVRHPRKYLPQNHKLYLSMDGVTEVEGPGWTDDRAFVVTAIDPFGLCGGRKNKEKPFWEETSISATSSAK